MDQIVDNFSTTYASICPRVLLHRELSRPIIIQASRIFARSAQSPHIAALPKRAFRIKVVGITFSTIGQLHNTDPFQPTRQSENNWASFPAWLDPVSSGLVTSEADHVFYRAWLSCADFRKKVDSASRRNWIEIVEATSCKDTKVRRVWHGKDDG